MDVALVVYPGVLDEECVAFGTVLGLVRDWTVTTVGQTVGPCAGPGGVQVVERSFGELRHPDVVVVPGGLGCEHAATDVQLGEWLREVAATARYVVGSSTGSVVLAAAGLLHGRPASTHWLAADLLERFGSAAASDRLVVSGNVVTCEGRVSAVDAALHLVHRMEGPIEAERVRTTLMAPTPGPDRHVGRFARLRAGIRHRRDDERRDPPRPFHAGAVSPSTIEIELVPIDDSR